MSVITSFPSPDRSSLNAQFGILCRALKRSNHLAKQLNGHQKGEMYQQKADLASFMILAGQASANGIHANGTVGLDIKSNTPYRLHVPLNSLYPEARTIVRRQITSAPVTCSVREHLESKRRVKYV